MTSPDTRVPVTVIIAAKNEAGNISACLASVAWAAETIVAEHGSTDDTVARAMQQGAVVISEEAPTIGMQRNQAIARARSPWILVVDADERGTPELAAAVRKTIDEGRHDAFRVPRRNFFLGAEIRHGGWERDRPVRLFRRELRYNESKVHEHVIVSGEPGIVGAALLHYPYGSLDRYFEKFERYSRWWADQQHAKGRRTSVLAVLVKPPARFFSMYVLRLGFLDGPQGVILAALAAASVLAKYVRLWGKQHEPSSESSSTSSCAS